MGASSVVGSSGKESARGGSCTERGALKGDEKLPGDDGSWPP
jgi:hypothetical protein